MSFPAALDSFPHVVQDGTAVTSEAHTVPSSGPYTVRLGASAPSGWQLIIPDGAFPLSAPGGVTLTGITATGGGLTTSGVYKVFVVFGTQYGETVAGTETDITLSGGQNAIQISAIPTGGTTTNPVLYRKIFRSTNGGGAGTAKLTVFIDDNTTTEVVDTLADAAFPTAAPGVSNTSGQQLVTISGYTEVANSPGANQFSVDYSITSTGGLVTFNSANASASVNINYTGGTLVNSSLLNSMIDAINNLETVAAHGVRQKSVTPNPNSNLLMTASATYTNMPVGFSVPSMTVHAGGGNLAFRISGNLVPNSGQLSEYTVNFQLVVTKPDTTTANVFLGQFYSTGNFDGLTFAAENALTGLAAGTHTFALQYKTGIDLKLDPGSSQLLTLVVEEYL